MFAALAFIKEYARFIIIGLVAILLFSIGWSVRGWKDATIIADLKIERANIAAAQANGALDDLTKATKNIHEAAKRYGESQIDLAGKIDDLKKDIKNETPLPVDCKPNDSRVRKLDAGINAANKASSGNKAGRPLP